MENTVLNKIDGRMSGIDLNNENFGIWMRRILSETFRCRLHTLQREWSARIAIAIMYR